MTEIEKLEAEIAEKKEVLRRLKEAEKPGRHLDFRKFYRTSIDGVTEFSCDPLLHHLRGLAITLSTTHLRTRPNNTRYIACLRGVKASELDEAHKRICNAFLDELFPVFEKYANIFAHLS